MVARTLFALSSACLAVTIVFARATLDDQNNQIRQLELGGGSDYTSRYSVTTIHERDLQVQPQMAKYMLRLQTINLKIELGLQLQESMQRQRRASCHKTRKKKRNWNIANPSKKIRRVENIYCKRDYYHNSPFFEDPDGKPSPLCQQFKIQLTGGRPNPVIVIDLSGSEKFTRSIQLARFIGPAYSMCNTVESGKTGFGLFGLSDFLVAYKGEGTPNAEVLKWSTTKLIEVLEKVRINDVDFMRDVKAINDLGDRYMKEQARKASDAKLLRNQKKNIVTQARASGGLDLQLMFLVAEAIRFKCWENEVQNHWGKEILAPKDQLFRGQWASNNNEVGISEKEAYLRTGPGHGRTETGKSKQQRSEPFSTVGLGEVSQFKFVGYDSGKNRSASTHSLETYKSKFT